MKIKFNRRIIILSTSTILFFTVLSVLFINYWNYQQNILNNFKNCEDEEGCLRIYGNVLDEYYIGINTLKNETYPRVEDLLFYQLNMYNNSIDYLISGVRLWDIFNITGIWVSGAEFFQFQSTDGYKTYQLPLQFLLDNPDAIIIVTHINGSELLTKEEGGDGPLKSAVFLEPLQESEVVQEIFVQNDQEFVHNSKFSVKYLNMIELI